MDSIKNSTNNKCSRGCEENGTFLGKGSAGGTVNCCSHYGEEYEGYSKN